MKYKGFNNRAELYRAAADSLEMQEKAGVEPLIKFDGIVSPLENCSFTGSLDRYEFPVGVVEGKHVWLGDALWCGGIQINVTDELFDVPRCELSWNPPKPKTVMVRLPVYVLEYIALDSWNSSQMIEAKYIAKAALEKLNAAN